MTSAHLASIPSRIKLLYEVLQSLSPMVDKVFVSLNGYIGVPIYYREFPNVEFTINDNSLGDAMKFSRVNEVDGTLFICDDDLYYTPKYFETLQKGLEQYRCPVSLHGKGYFKDGFRGFKRPSGIYHCLHTLKEDSGCNLIGTGVLAYKSGMVKVDLARFEKPNMADVWFSLLCHEQGVPMMVLKHPNNLVKYLRPQITIWHTQKDTSLHDEIIRRMLV